MQEVQKQQTWHFQIGPQEVINAPTFISIGFQQQDQQNSQNLNNDSFCRPPVVSAQCTVSTEKYPDAAIIN